MSSTATAAREQIVDAAMKRFADQGYAATSLSEIAADLGRSKSAVLYHFDSKESILREIVAPTTEALRELLDRCESLPRDDARRAAALGFVDIVVEHRTAMSAYPAPVRTLRKIPELADLDLAGIGTRLRALLARDEDPLVDAVATNMFFSGSITAAFKLASARPEELRAALHALAARMFDLAPPPTEPSPTSVPRA